MTPPQFYRDNNILVSWNGKAWYYVHRDQKSLFRIPSRCTACFKEFEDDEKCYPVRRNHQPGKGNHTVLCKTCLYKFAEFLQPKNSNKLKSGWAADSNGIYCPASENHDTSRTGPAICYVCRDDINERTYIIHSNTKSEASSLLQSNSSKSIRTVHLKCLKKIQSSHVL